MAGKILHAAVVGASTLLGKELLDEINDSSAVAWDLKLLEEGDDVEGQLTAAGDEALVLHALNHEAFAGLDLVFFAGSSELTSKYLRTAMRAGAAVVDLSGAAQGESGFLTRTPWLKGGHRPDLTTSGMVVPHTAALMLGLAAERLQGKFGHVEMAATVLEPASQAGSAGVDELHQQTVGLLSFQEVPKAVFDTQIAFNFHGSLGDEAKFPLNAIRSRIQADLGQALGAGFDGSISIMLLQAPVFHGYTISAHVRLAADVSEDALRSAVDGGVVSAEAETVASNQAATESGNLLIRVEKTPEDAKAIWLLMASDNLRLMARSAVHSALELAALRPGSRVQ